MQIAERAYRRPLTAAERDDLLAFYRKLRKKGELGHEEALLDTFVSVLLSPHFCYRFAPRRRARTHSRCPIMRWPAG